MASSQSLPPLLLVLLFCGHACSHVDALTIDDLYPFGAANGDTVMEGYVTSDLIPLPYPVPLFGVEGVSGAYVNPNGAVHFREPRDYGVPYQFPAAGDQYSMVAAFWTFLAPSCDSCIAMGFRAVDDAALLADIAGDIRGAFPTEALAAGFVAESALIVTWINVTLFESRIAADKTVHTFQAVIAFNTRTVFVGLLLPNLTYPGIGAAEAGFNLGDIFGDGERSFRLPTSFSTAPRFDKLSNVGQAGKWWFGLDKSSSSGASIGTFAYIDRPPATAACALARVYGDTGLDACGNARVMDWDFNNDGSFNDATSNTIPFIFTDNLRLTPGLHPIRARVSSRSPCPGASSDPLVLSTTLNITNIPPLRISFVGSDPATGNPKPYAGEAVRVFIQAVGLVYCNDAATTIDCGGGFIASQAGCQPQVPCLEGVCQYSTPGNYTIAATITQNGVSVFGTRNITVVEYKPACSSDAYPAGGRPLGRRACAADKWTSSHFRCNYPVAAGIKTYTPLWAAFASRSAEDAAVIRRFYGNRTMDQTLRKRYFEADFFASEAAVALLNALTLPYPQCPSTVKAKFRHALYHGVDSDEARAVFRTFLLQNNRGYNGGCTLSYCA